jgi:hypothetical protein
MPIFRSKIKVFTKETRFAIWKQKKFKKFSIFFIFLLTLLLRLIYDGVNGRGGEERKCIPFLHHKNCYEEDFSTTSQK